VQCDLTKPEHVVRAFGTPDDTKFDYVINLCGETRFGLPEDDYQKKCVNTAVECAKAASSMGITKWVEVSTSQVYSSSKKPSTEDDIKLEPWTRQATSRLEAESKVTEAGLPVVILRPATVYGPGDLTGLTPRIATAASYVYLKEKMKFLWSADLKMNVVHVKDLVKAIWLAASQFEAGSVYNLADSSELDQGKLNSLLAEIFNIETGFHGAVVSKMAETVSMDSIVAHANEKHVPAWQHICQEHGIANTPISPYIDKELLYNRHLSVSGEKIVGQAEFSYDYPKLTADIMREQIQKFIDAKYFPAII
jgi:nucleoside-diphosphate-sugar epimerase